MAQDKQAPGSLPLLLYNRLLAHYGEPNWWPAQSSYEVMVGAVLTQNTAWGNVEQAIARFGDELRPETVAAMPTERLAQIIRPAGFFTRKTGYLQAVTAWFARYGYDVPTVQAQPMDRLRAELLATRGVGPETADSILLYAFDRPSFVVDAYTCRLCARYPIPAGDGYDAVKTYFEAALPRDAAVYNRLHALIVIHGKAHCKKRPDCRGCPLADGSCHRPA